MPFPFENFGLDHHPVMIPAAAVALAAGTGLTLWAVLRSRPTAAELEERRRHLLATTGRIIDGTLVGVEPSERDPSIVFYTYRVAGVGYECAQDVSPIVPRVTHLHLDFPVQVRYSRANPGNSIVVDEAWNGLWSASREPFGERNA